MAPIVQMNLRELGEIADEMDRWFGTVIKGSNETQI